MLTRSQRSRKMKEMMLWSIDFTYGRNWTSVLLYLSGKCSCAKWDVLISVFSEMLAFSVFVHFTRFKTIVLVGPCFALRDLEELSFFGANGVCDVSSVHLVGSGTGYHQ